MSKGRYDETFAGEDDENVQCVKTTNRNETCIFKENAEFSLPYISVYDGHSSSSFGDSTGKQVFFNYHLLAHSVNVSSKSSG